MATRDVASPARRARIDLASGAEAERLAPRRAAAMAHARAMAPHPGRGYFRPVPGGNNWVPLGPIAIPQGQTYSRTGIRVLASGRITAIVVDPTDPSSGTIYLGSAYGGVWKTVDGGATWTPMSDYEASLAIGALALDPINGVLYAGTGEGNLAYLAPIQNFVQDSFYGNGLLKSPDGGLTWTLQGAAEFTGAAFFRIVVNPPNPAIVFAATSNGLYRSMDGGFSWSLVPGLPAVSATILACSDVVITPSGAVYAAFWADGIYQSSNATAANPTWSKLAGGLPSPLGSGLPDPNYGRIGLAVSPSSPQTLYASLVTAKVTPSDESDIFRTDDGGMTWSNQTWLLGLPLNNYCNNIAVHPTDPNIYYLSAYGDPVNGGSGLWKLTPNATARIGDNIHPDQHSFAFDPRNPSVIYAGGDGGIYKSSDGGTTWTDAINKGLCITQFEFIAQHPASDTVVFGGSQDNGTEQFRNSPVFNHADDGDGGYTAVDQSQPHNVLHTYEKLTLARSTEGGKFGTWVDVSQGLQGGVLFYPPFALNAADQSEIAYGTDHLNLDGAQGVAGWPTQVALPGTSLVSAVNFVNWNLIYAGTVAGEVYSLIVKAGLWAVTPIHAAPFPARFIWDIATRPGDPNTVIIAVSGFGTGHVWMGAVSGTGTATWTDVSGTGASRLPDIPAYAVVVDPADPTANTIYAGTDIGVFRTVDGGLTWSPFSAGLPNGPVFDLELHTAARLLRACIHGRGMWELKLDVNAMPDASVFVRHNVMDTGRVRPAPINAGAAFEDPLEYVRLGETVRWWQCTDIKNDAPEGTPPAFQMNAPKVDFAAFESGLEHRNPQRGFRANRVYVQLHNRGITPAPNVTVKILFATAAAELPPLPPDFWTAFPANSTDTTGWKPIGSAQTIASLSPTIPTVLEWDWTLPARAADHVCMLVVADSPSDPIPAANKVFDIVPLVAQERRVGLKNVHVVNISPGTDSNWTLFWFFGDPRVTHTIRISSVTADGWNAGLLLRGRGQNLALDGVSARRISPWLIFALFNLLIDAINRAIFGNVQPVYSLIALLLRSLIYWQVGLYVLDQPAQGGSIAGVRIPSAGLCVPVLFFRQEPGAPGGFTAGSVSIMLETGGQIVGGSTFALKPVG